ncbi:NACHT domain-containing protein [Streptomyces sp. NPDC091272]|uniref:NACHT domain-containing protein n=1 Tax=Streptomyces sp. NPDC091272 TaxID=3365981 RepID=UPI00382F1F3E
MGMRGRRLLSYRDAVAILGGDSEALTAADQALGGALSAATGGASDAVLGIFGAQGRLLRLGRDLTGGLRDRLSGAGRTERTQKIAAAHAVLVVTAYFEVLAECELPFEVRDLGITAGEQVALAGGDRDAVDVVQRLLFAEVPQPGPTLPYETFVVDLGIWYMNTTASLLSFVRGLAVWDGLSGRQRHRAEDVLTELSVAAVERHGELYAQLALEVPEFGFWSAQVEQQATRHQIRHSLSGVESCLRGLVNPPALHHAAVGLDIGYRAALGKAILSEGEAPSGLMLPTLARGYVDPDFRVSAVPGDGNGPAHESWWESLPVRSDLTEFLAGTLTSLTSTTAPLLVLGQPGAGKSVLTKILAARLGATGFLPVRVVLREVRAEDEVQDQIEHAVRAATGEQVTWTELVRSAQGAVPVLLFDGFDELLQATGVSQSDYLVRVARFQQREAELGRPVYAMVTSRTAVADRARCPEGTVAVRLEPFGEPHIRRWLDVWNELNTPHFTAHGLRPLTAEVACRHAELASQPLLLLMLALHDANANALQREADSGNPLAAADLYEELLASFAVREIGKSGDGLTRRQLADHAERELQRLSLIAFGILNRRRQWITAAELDEDLTALLGRPQGAVSADFRRTPLNQAEVALGRFFFVQKAQAVQGGRELTTYEFLHATFGEYLVARLAVVLLDQLLDQRPALSLGRAHADDEMMYALLSYALLASRQMLRFVEARIGHLAPQRRERLGELLISVMDDARQRVEHRYADYRPISRATAARHGKYEANLLVLTLLVTGGVTTSELFPGASDPAGVWPHRVQLYRSALTEQEWADFAAALQVHRGWAGERRELTVLPVSAVVPPGGEWAVDPYWSFRYGPDHEYRTTEVTWSRTYSEESRHRMDVADAGQDLVVRHALDPIFERFGIAMTTFYGEADGRATSWAHDLMDLWLSSHLEPLDPELAVRYERCARMLRQARGAPSDMWTKLSAIVAGQLLSDAHRVPAAVVHRVVRALETDRDTAASLVLRARIVLRRLDTVLPDPGEEQAEALAVLRECLDDALATLASDAPQWLPSVWAEESHTRLARQLLPHYAGRVPDEVADQLRALHSRYDEPSAG